MPSFVVKESLNSVKVFWLEQEKLLTQLRNLAVKIGKKDKNILKIILFGSLAERRAVPGSDADILVILQRDDKPFMERLVEWSRRFTLDFPVEVFPYTKKELNNPVASEAINKGTVLFER
ncbi:hypothetical protein ES706_03569 [subsurface metagenome]